MKEFRNRRLELAIGATLAIVVTATAQEQPIIPSFPTAIVNRVWDDQGDLTATYSRAGDELSIKVKKAATRQVESGWAGVCVQNATPVNLQNFTHATAQVEPSARVVMDVKLEKTKYQEGTLLLTDHGTVSAGRRTLEWNLRSSNEVAGEGTLSQTRRMCFYVWADNFPARQDEVVVKVSRIRFNRRPNS